MQTVLIAPHRTRILQTAIAAVAAWYLAILLLDDPRPAFASIAAVISLAAAHGQRRRQAFELVGGVMLGIAVAAALLFLIGTGPLQTGLLIVLAMSAALALRGGDVLVNEAAVSAILLAALPQHDSAFIIDRVFEGLIGGGVALAIASLLFSPDPVLMVNRVAQSVVGKLGHTLEETAAALEDGDAPRAQKALNAARAIDDEVEALEDIIPAASETARFSPVRRGDRAILRRYEHSTPQVDLAVRNARVLTRSVLRHARTPQTAPEELPAAVRELADAVWELGAQYDAPERDHRDAAARAQRRPPRRQPLRARAVARADADRRPGALGRGRPRARLRAARRPGDPRVGPADRGAPALALERAAEQRDRLGERLVGHRGVVAVADVAAEGVLGLVLAPRQPRGERVEPGLDRLAPGLRRVRVLRAPDREQLALDLAGAGERAGVRVLAELAVVQPGRVPARGRAHLRAERGAEREVAAGAVARGADRARPLAEPGERGVDVGVEVGHRGRVGVALAAHLALVVELEHGPGRLEPVVDLGHRDEVAVAGEPHRPAQRRLGELEDVGVEDDAGVRTARARRGDEGAHLPAVHRDVDVLAREDHDRAFCTAMAKSISTLLRAPSGPIDLGEFDPRATPGFKKGKSGAQKAQAKHAERLATLQEQLFAEGRKGGARSVLLVLQGLDTSGKGGTVRHVVGPCDPAGVHAASFGRPTAEELRHDFLWRIRQQLPRAGKLGVFDRSHYEDVLAVRVRKLADKRTWTRRYDAINRFEAELAEGGTRIVKCYLHISREEQRARLIARLGDPTKHWKYNPHDLEDRALWDDYMAAYADALERCSTEAAPWHIIPADRKWYRNWAITQLLSEELEGLGLQWPEADFDVAEELRRVRSVA